MSCQLLPLSARAEQAHAAGEHHGIGIGRADGDGVPVQHALGEGVADDLALEVRQLRQADQVGAAVLPGLAAVGGADHAVDLQRGVDLVGPRGVLHHAHDAHGERRRGAILDAGIGQPPPALRRCRRCDRRRPASRRHRCAWRPWNRPGTTRSACPCRGSSRAGTSRRDRCCATRRRPCRRIRRWGRSDARRPCGSPGRFSTCCHSPPAAARRNTPTLPFSSGTPDIAGHAGVDVRLRCHETFLLSPPCCRAERRAERPTASPASLDCRHDRTFQPHLQCAAREIEARSPGSPPPAPHPCGL